MDVVDIAEEQLSLGVVFVDIFEAATLESISLGYGPGSSVKYSKLVIREVYVSASDLLEHSLIILTSLGHEALLHLRRPPD